MEEKAYPQVDFIIKREGSTPDALELATQPSYPTGRLSL